MPWGPDCACLLDVQVWVDDDEQAESLAMVVRSGLATHLSYAFVPVVIPLHLL